MSIDGKARDLERGAHMTDYWTDINSLQTWSPERLGYPTQKPVALLERIIQCSTDEGDVVLDPFCGCGTAIDAAEKLNREWIGIDITHLAINLMKQRLRDTHVLEPGDDYTVTGEPETVDGAEQLATEDPYQFQWWALGLVGARPHEQKKGADKGVDGKLFFHEKPGGETKQVILSVKSGKVGVKDVRELQQVVKRESAQMGVLITLRSPTQPMRAEAAATGDYSTPWGSHPRTQILTIEDIMERNLRIDMPPPGTSVTFRKAEKHEAPGGDQTSLELE